MVFKPIGQRRAVSALQFPQLREIFVTTTGALSSERYTHVEACVGRLLGPSLRYFDIGSQRWRHYVASPFGCSVRVDESISDQESWRGQGRSFESLSIDARLVVSYAGYIRYKES